MAQNGRRRMEVARLSNPRVEALAAISRAKRKRQQASSSDRPFGIRLIEARQAQGWTRSELSRQAGLSPNAIGKIEEQKTTIDDVLARYKALVECVGGVFIVKFPGE